MEIKNIQDILEIPVNVAIEIVKPKSTYYQRNKEKVKARLKEYNERPEVKAKTKIVASKKMQRRKLSQYGMIQEDYDAKLNEQNFVCEICKNPETSYDSRLKLTKRLAIDHCHETGKIRGLLCGKCNLTLGRMNENIEHLQSMINYIIKYK